MGKVLFSVCLFVRPRRWGEGEGIPPWSLVLCGGGRYPLVLFNVLSPKDKGYPPLLFPFPLGRRESACYATGGKPHAVPQEDFLVIMCVLYLHVSEFRNGAFLVFTLRRFVRIQLDHLFVQILPQNRILHLRLQKRSTTTTTKSSVRQTVNKKVLLRELKRHTACRVASARSAAVS